MGAGKSTVGKKIASMLKRDFYDTDKIIEKEQNRTISNIFREDGEDYFRLLEKISFINYNQHNESWLSLYFAISIGEFLRTGA